MVKRRLNNSHQRRAKRETRNHRDTQRESHLYDGPAKVFEMLEKRLGRFGLRRITKFKDVSQRHRVAFVRMPGDPSLTPGFSHVQPTERTTNRFNGFELKWKPLKRHADHPRCRTRLKPGVNENSKMISHGRGASDRRPRAASVAQMPSVLASRISLSAIMRRISSLLNPRQSRIDSPSSRSGPSAQG